MRRIAIALFSLTTLACKADPPADTAARKGDESSPPASVEPAKPTEPAKPAPAAREDLYARDLPAVPTLTPASVTIIASGEFASPEGTDELAPRVALALADGLLLAGQAYYQRNSAPPPKSWRWTGFVPSDPDAEPVSRLSDPGAIRTGIVSDGRGLLTGTRGLGFDARAWFATVDGDGVVKNETALETPSSTEMFAAIPGQGSGKKGEELAVLGGYVDAQGWLVSLDANAQPRWDKYIGSYGYTQVRALARLDGDQLLAIGTRGEKFGEAWSARAPADGGESAAATDVTQTKIEIEGADPNRSLRALVDLGEPGFIALGTAKQNYLQAHDQVIAVGFDRKGKVQWSRVVEGVRVIDIHGARAHAGAAHFIVTIPTDDSPKPATALALVTLTPNNADLARHLSDSDAWTSAGFMVGSDGANPELIAYTASADGLDWRRLAMPDPAH